MLCFRNDISKAASPPIVVLFYDEPKWWIYLKWKGIRGVTETFFIWYPIIFILYLSFCQNSQKKKKSELTKYTHPDLKNVGNIQSKLPRQKLLSSNLPFVSPNLKYSKTINSQLFQFEIQNRWVFPLWFKFGVVYLISV